MTQHKDEGERIAKVMARAGVASRRDAERMIVEGRVAVNGKAVTSPALDITPADRVTVDGTVNPLDALARNELSVLIAVRLSPLAQLINVEIVKVPLSAAL